MYSTLVTLVYCFFQYYMLFSAQAPHFQGSLGGGGPKILKHTQIDVWWTHFFLKIVWSQLEPSGGRAPKTTLTKAESRDGRCRDICLSHELDLKWLEDMSLHLYYPSFVDGDESSGLFPLIDSFKRAPQKCLGSRKILTKWSDIFRYLENGGGP